MAKKDAALSIQIIIYNKLLVCTHISCIINLFQTVLRKQYDSVVCEGDFFIKSENKILNNHKDSNRMLCYQAMFV